jgi:hypothetical protein
MVKSIFKQRSGAAIIEFAIVAPVLFLFLIGILETGLIFFTSSVLEGATNIGARIGKTGFSAGMTREAYIRSEVQRLSGGFLDPANLTITMLAYDSFTHIGQPEPCILPPQPPCPGTAGVNFIDTNHNGQWDEDQGRTDAGQHGEIVLYRVNYPWALFTPLMSAIMGDPTGHINITSIATVRNERF